MDKLAIVAKCKAIREERNLSKSVVAKSMKMHRVTYDDFETGKMGDKNFLMYLTRFCQVFNLNKDEWITPIQVKEFIDKRSEKERKVFEDIPKVESVKELDPKEKKKLCKKIICKALQECCDITTACSLAKINKYQLYRWMQDDDDFAADVIVAKERAVRSLVMKCKSEPSTAWKLLKNLAKNRWVDDANLSVTGHNVQILMNIPRPDSELQTTEVKLLDEPKKSDGIIKLIESKVVDDGKAEKLIEEKQNG